jgi:hypothetical protein
MMENAAALKPSRYIEPAPAVDVLYDQLDFLIRNHGLDANHTWEGCAACDRLAVIEEMLLAPFEETSKRRELSSRVPRKAPFMPIEPKAA